MSIALKKFHHFNSKTKTSKTVESALRGLIVNIGLGFYVIKKTHLSVSF